MKIGIDGSPILKEKTGVGNYVYNLIKWLGNIDSVNEYSIFLNSFKGSFNANIKYQNFKIKRFRIPGKILMLSWGYLKFPPIDLLTGKFDIFHSTNFIIPPKKEGKIIITIHDLYFMKYPENTELFGGRYFKRFLPSNINKVDKIIAVSRSTKRDIINILGVNEDKIEVIYEGVDNIFKPINDRVKVLKIKDRYSLPDKFILFVGSIEPRKNILSLIKSFSLIRSKIEHKLVVVGSKGWGYKNIFDAIDSLNLRKSVMFTGYVPEYDLPYIYNASDLFVFPSFYEGFGLPVLEAMACGIPVIASNRSSIPEIIGDSGIVIDPDNIHELKDAMLNLLNNDELKKRLIDKGIKRASMFSWEKTAYNTLDLYKSVINENSY
jgi:glycosyltransferase involved in cell wall biosynthesis